jgi:hypothetical protein
MVHKLGLTVALAAGVALPAATSAEAAMTVDSLRPMIAQMTPVENAQFLWGGQQYCWYDDGWRGPGWYWCGYAWNNGFGWGGGYGWHGWRGGHPGRWRGGHVLHGGAAPAFHGGAAHVFHGGGAHVFHGGGMRFHAGGHGGGPRHH